jgi:hypothetical protein
VSPNALKVKQVFDGPGLKKRAKDEAEVNTFKAN